MLLKVWLICVLMKAIYWDEENQGSKFELKDIPEHMADECDHYREALVEAAAESSEELMEIYLENSELDEASIRKGIRMRTLANEIVPMLCGSAFKNKGVQAMLDAVIDYMPSPQDVDAVVGIADDKDGTEVACEPKDDAAFAALAFKITTDPFVGTLTYFRVYSGVLKSGDTIYNPLKGKRERIGRLVQMHSNSREEIKSVCAGDIAAAVGLKTATTGDTLCEREAGSDT